MQKKNTRAKICRNTLISEPFTVSEPQWEDVWCFRSCDFITLVSTLSHGCRVEVLLVPPAGTYWCRTRGNEVLTWDNAMCLTMFYYIVLCSEHQL